MFIYVMDEESRDKLLKLGFELLKKHDGRSVWVFINKQELEFDAIAEDIDCVVTDILTF